MRVLAVDIGTGTQDVLLFDTESELDNCVQAVLPSPTRIVGDRIRTATAEGRGVFLTGVTMGGGPSSWALEDHMRLGLPVAATPRAASTIDDDLDRVASLGVTIQPEDSVAPTGFATVEMIDFDFAAIAKALGSFGVNVDVDFIAIAVFDHGAAPAGFSDRLFRFGYLARTVETGDLAAFAYERGRIPEALTRMRAVASSVPDDTPLVVMDTAPAAILGAMEDARIRSAPSSIVVNLGNMHTLAFHVADGQPIALFEHHTGELTKQQLEGFLGDLADGTISHESVFTTKGHGALVRRPPTRQPSVLGVVGPRRRLLAGSHLHPYFAVPHGAMMLTGCFGLLRALAARIPETATAISDALDRAVD